MIKTIAAIVFTMLIASHVQADEEIQLAAAIGSSSTRSETGAIKQREDAETKKKPAGATAKSAAMFAETDALVYGIVAGIGLLAAAR